MGVEIGVFIREERLPRAELWSAAVAALRIPVEVLDDPNEALGTQPFRLDGDDVHVQAMVVRRTDEEDWDELREDLGRRRARILADVDTFVVYRFSGSTAEMVCASAACAGLVAAADGVLWDMEGDEVLAGREAIALTRQVVDEGRRDQEEAQALRKGDADRLWERGLLPRLEIAGAPPVHAHGWVLVVGEPGWLAPIVGVASHPHQDPFVTLWCKVAHLYAGHPHAAMTTYLELGRDRPAELRMIRISRRPGPTQEVALDRIADLIVAEALPHLATVPDLEAMAAALERSVDGGDPVDEHEVEALAATHVLLGATDEAARRYRQVEHIHAAADDTHRVPGDWVDQQRRRVTEMAVLAATDPETAIHRLAATARENARELGIPPPELP